MAVNIRNFFVTASAATVTNVPLDVVPVTLLAANPDRKSVVVYNDSGQTCYIKFGSTPTSTSFTVPILTGTSYTLPLPCYPGLLSGFFSGGTNVSAYWKFDEGSGTSAADLSGNTNTGTLLNGPTWVSGVSGTGVQLDGTNDSIEAAHSSSLNITGNAFSICAWVKVNGDNTLSDTAQTVICKPVSGSGHTSPFFSYCLHLIRNSATNWTPRFFLSLAGVAQTVSSSVSVGTGAFFHFAGIYNGATMKIYIDGVERGSLSITGNISGYSTPVRIGLNGGSLEAFKGVIDNVMIFSRAISTTELANIITPATTALRVTEIV